MHYLVLQGALVMSIYNNKNSIEKKPRNSLNNINNYYIKIDYFDNKGIKKYIDKVPFKFVFGSKINTPQNSNYIK